MLITRARKQRSATRHVGLIVRGARPISNRFQSEAWGCCGWRQKHPQKCLLHAGREGLIETVGRVRRATACRRFLGRMFRVANEGINMSTDSGSVGGNPISMAGFVQHELHHVRAHWWWFLILGILLVVAGTIAIVVPQFTVLTTLAATTLVSVLLMFGGVATIIS